MHGSSVPLLQKVAICILSQPYSSSSCERNWSAFEAVQTKKINRLTPDMLEDLVYLRMNSLMKIKSKDIEKFSKESINSDKLVDIQIDEDVKVEDEEGARREYDQTLHDRELGIGSALDSDYMNTPIYSGTLSQLCNITHTPFTHDSETQAPFDMNN
ncbi:uncharacterized protein LOC122080935 [Macadamia integrifolia]|uniref:uncharacterized protein LOC122080935 n=1 Tax=Macadamia integrifolia TaxID=60698 RepID=UPI001C4EBB8F|nr:uncharacterized protein LOC122080935 [Macadamia integrifolia]